MKKKEKKERIISAAENLFASRRYHEVKLDEVAKAAKVGKGTIYLYFKDKDDLFFQAATFRFDQMCDILESEIPKDAPFEKKLILICTQIHHFMESRRPIMKMMREHEVRAHSFRGRMKKTWLQHRNKLDEIVGKVFLQGIDEKLIQEKFTPKVLAKLLLSFMGGRAMAFEEEPGKAPSLEELLGIFLYGISKNVRKASGAK